MNFLLHPSSSGRWLPGQSSAEFGLVASTFFLLMFAIIQMALAVYNYNTVCSAARECARYAIVHSATSAKPAITAQIQQIAIDAAPGLNLSTSNVSVTWPADPRQPSQKDVLVTVTYNLSFQIPFASAVTLPMTGSTQMLVSQ